MKKFSTYAVFALALLGCLAEDVFAFRIIRRPAVVVVARPDVVVVGS